MIIILDFGSQTTHLIARRIKEMGVEVKIFPPQTLPDQILAQKPKGIILSGGPASVYAKNAPSCDPQIFKIGLPILGICYGFQLMAHLLGGEVKKGLKKEYGPAKLRFRSKNSELRIIEGLPKIITAWVSHGDEVVKLPPGFRIIGSTTDIPITFAGNEEEELYGVQFHPEVSHTPQGSQILKNFFNICNLRPQDNQTQSVQFLVGVIKKRIGSQKAVCALSGGVDSAVAAVLTHRAIGKNLTCFYVDTGLMREGETAEIVSTFKKHFHLNLKVIKAEKIFLEKLKSVTNPERKRKIIGQTFIRVFESESKKMGKVPFLIQGTIYPDVIESQGTSLSAKIKSHHNVGGLPKNHGFKIVEPLRHLYKDEVRRLAKKLSLPKEIIHRQVFPGPGLAVRIIGAVTTQRLKLLRKADWIVREEIKGAHLEKKLWMAFAILTGVKTTAVMGDGRVYGETIALRALESKDAMTANFAHLPYPLLSKISSRIVNEVPGVSRVVYDITTKPPATMEWE